MNRFPSQQAPSSIASRRLLRSLSAAARRGLARGASTAPCASVVLLSGLASCAGFAPSYERNAPTVSTASTSGSSSGTYGAASSASGAGYRTSWPSWYDEPVSWAKLKDVEAWLAGNRRRDPALVPEAELQLAEGRVELSRREHGRVDPKLLSLRLNTAEAGFRRVLSGATVNDEQRRRARIGMGAVESLRAGDPLGATLAAPLRKTRRESPKGSTSRSMRVLERKHWGAAPARAPRLTQNRTPWNRITIHHSAKHTSELGRGTREEVAATLRKIQRFHFQTNNWGDIGYHFLIDPSGRIWQGRTLEWQGAHADGNNNVANLGICLLGNFVNERPDPRALASLESLVNALRVRHRIALSRVYGHDHFKPTDCPGEPLNAWLRVYQQRYGSRLSAATPTTAQ